MNIDELSMNFIYFLYKFSALGSTCLWRTKWIKYPNVSFLLVILVFSIYIFFILGTSECLESSWKSHGPFFQVCYLHFQAGQVEERVDVARMVPQRLEKLVLRVFRIVQQGPEVVVGTRVRRPQPAFEQKKSATWGTICSKQATGVRWVWRWRETIRQTRLIYWRPWSVSYAKAILVYSGAPVVKLVINTWVLLPLD